MQEHMRTHMQAICIVRKNASKKIVLSQSAHQGNISTTKNMSLFDQWQKAIPCDSISAEITYCIFKSTISS